MTRSVRLSTGKIVRFSPNPKGGFHSVVLVELTDSEHGELEAILFDRIEERHDALERAALVHEDVNIEGCDAMGALIRFRDQIRALK